MTLASLQMQLIPKINHNLQVFFDSQDFGQSQNLKQMIAYHMGWEDGGTATGNTGKRVRPLLTLLCVGAFEADLEAAMPAALAIELLHNFTLIHDDIEDQSPFRHGRTTLWKKWGVAQAVNAGDALFSIAQLAMLGLAETCGVSVAVQAARQLNQVCLRLTRGQYLDIAFEDADMVALDNYLDMITGKTAALIAFSATMGGLTAGQDSDKQALLADFGESLGLAFQIQDDYLGIWGNPDITGKSTASDLLTHKKTLPVLFGLWECPEFRALWEQAQPSIEQVERMSVLLGECGAQAYVKDQAEHFTNQAFSDLDAIFPQENMYAKALFELCERLLDRKS